jgi:hypothetical protein
MNQTVANFLLKRTEKSLGRLANADIIKANSPADDYVAEALSAVSAARVHFETEELNNE